MLNYRGSKKDRMGFTIPFFKEGRKSLRSLQGRYIFYVIIICSLIGFAIQGPISNALKEHEISLKGRNLNQMEEQTIEERATLITMGVTVFLLIVFIFSMGHIIKIFGKRPAEKPDEEEHQNA